MQDIVLKDRSFLFDKESELLFAWMQCLFSNLPSGIRTSSWQAPSYVDLRKRPKVSIKGFGIVSELEIDRKLSALLRTYVNEIQYFCEACNQAYDDVSARQVKACAATENCLIGRCNNDWDVLRPMLKKIFHIESDI